MMESSTYTSNCTTDNKGDGSRCRGRDQAADFKDENGAKEYPFDVEVPIDDAIHGLQTGSREQIRSAIPALDFLHC